MPQFDFVNLPILWFFLRMCRNKDIANFKNVDWITFWPMGILCRAEVGFVFWVKVISMNAAEVGFLPNYQIGALQG